MTNEWQPIKTAPKDETRILVVGGKIIGELYDGEDLIIPVVAYYDGEWRAEHTCYYSVKAENPTH